MSERRPGQVRVMVVEDSPLFAETLTEMLEADGELRVEAVARDGMEAVDLVQRVRPDVVVMDLHLPRLDGLSATERIMARAPTPILVMTADPAGQEGRLAFEALRRGALELVAKPSEWSGTDAERAELRERVRLLARVPVLRRAAEAAGSSSDLAARRAGPAAAGIVALVASTGGPAALARLLGSLPASFPLPIVLVQHLCSGFTERFASWLDGCCPLEVRIAQAGIVPARGRVWVAPDGAHLVVGAGGKLALERGEPMAGHCPSGDRLLASVAQAYGSRAVAGVLTGMGEDGAEGLLRVRERGGCTFVQDEGSSVVFGMPRAALERGATQLELPLDEIAGWLCRGVRRNPRRHDGLA